MYKCWYWVLEFSRVFWKLRFIWGTFVRTTTVTSLRTTDTNLFISLPSLPLLAKANFKYFLQLFWVSIPKFYTKWMKNDTKFSVQHFYFHLRDHFKRFSLHEKRFLQNGWLPKSWNHSSCNFLNQIRSKSKPQGTCAPINSSRRRNI